MFRGYRSTIAALAASLLFAVACSDDSTPVTSDGSKKDGGSDLSLHDGRPDGPTTDIPQLPCTLTVQSINGLSISSLTQVDSSLDLDQTKAGIQVNVEVKVLGKPDGTTIELDVNGQTPRPTANAAMGIATFKGVTINVKPDLQVVTIKPVGSADCSAKSEFFSFQTDPTCEITRPTKGATLFPKDDEDLNNATFDYSVRVKVVNAKGGTVELKVAGASQGTQTADSFSTESTVSFSKVVLSSGQGLKLQAVVTLGKLIANCDTTVNVDIAKPKCILGGFVPAPISIPTGSGLGPKQDDDSVKDGMQTNVTVTTDTNVNKVTLAVVGGTKTWTATPAAGTATFSKIDLAEGTQTLQATCEDTTKGVAGVSAQSKAFVDTEPPPAVTDLACTVTNNRAGEVTCTFKALADAAPGSGIRVYQARYRANTDVTSANFDDPDTQKLPDLAPAAAGQTQTFKITKLQMPNTYDVSVKAIDLVTNESGLSNALATKPKVDFNVQTVTGAAGDQMGGQIAVGDFNCDGYADVAVGLRGRNNNRGEVDIFFSSGSGVPTVFSKVIKGTLDNGYFGIRIQALQFDNDPDGCMDLAVQAYGRNSNRGAVYLFLGRKVWTDRDDSSPGLGPEIVYSLPSTAAATERLGGAMGAADLTGDGNDDLLMLHWDTSGTQWATVLADYGEKNIPLMSGSSASEERTMPAKADLVVSGGSYLDQFGLGIGRAGFLDGDTYEDVIISAPQTALGGSPKGAVYVLKGAAALTTGTDTVALATSTRVIRINGIAANTRFGGVAGGVGDVNGDGVSEFIVTDPQQTVGAVAAAGAAYLFNLAGATAPSSASDAAAVYENDQASALQQTFGRSLAIGVANNAKKGADLNKDGRAEVLLGCSRLGASAVGAGLLFYGAAGTLTNKKTSGAEYVFGPPPLGTYQHSVSTVIAGDVNGDGYPDVVLGDLLYGSNTGRIVIYY